MKICYVGASAPRIFNLLSDMQDRGHEVHWIALDIPKYIIPNITLHNSTRLYGRSVIGRCLLTPYLFFIFLLKIKQISPDIVHAINVEWSGWYSVLSGFKNVIVTPQGGDVMIRNNTKNDILHKYLRRYTLLNAAGVTYGNDTMLNSICHWATPRRTLKYFAGVNFDALNFREHQCSARGKLSIGKNRKVVFSPRTCVPNSNIDIVIKTIPIVKKEFPSVIYVFAFHVESNDYLSKIKKMIGELNVEESCMFLKKVNINEMSSYYSISDVVISILSSDGMPATLLESMAMKKTLVLSQIPSYLELMNKEFALMVDHTDKQKTAEAIIKGLRQDDKTVKMQEIAYNWVKQNADFRKLNDSLEKFYSQLVFTAFENPSFQA